MPHSSVVHSISMTKAVILLSGGQDSATCLAIAKESFDRDLIGIGFFYGQRHANELKQANILADLAEIPFKTIDLSFISQLTPNALTDSNIAIEHAEGHLPSTFVPGRNLFFISVGAVIARQVGANKLFTGVCQTDFSGYPDCRHDFIQSAEKTINLAMETTIHIETPLMWLTKAETVMKMKELGKLSWYQHTHSCYHGVRPACGVCPACLLRLRGFNDAGIEDPIEYA